MIIEVIAKYYELLLKDQNHRYKSWEHCYQYFTDHYTELRDKKISDTGCLQLAFYLASWGMLRSSFLLQKDYKIHHYLLEEVISEAAFRHYFIGEKRELEKGEYQDIDELVSKIRKAYTDHISLVNGNDKQVEVSDTLASKILLGIYGNVPAYDRYFKQGVRLFGIEDKLGGRSIGQLIDFYNQYKQEFQACEKYDAVTEVKYTAMKWIDMFFWQIGYVMDDQNSKDLDLMRTIQMEAENYKRNAGQRGKIVGHAENNKSKKVIMIDTDHRKHDQELPAQIRGRSVTAKIIPTMANLKNVLWHLNSENWNEEKLKGWEKRSYKAYQLAQIKGMLNNKELNEQKEIIRQHILQLAGHELGASVVDIYLIGYLNHTYGQGKEILASWMEQQGITSEKGSVNAVWQVGKGDGVFLDILNKDGSIKDWSFMKKWVQDKLQ